MGFLVHQVNIVAAVFVDSAMQFLQGLKLQTVWNETIETYKKWERQTWHDSAVQQVSKVQQHCLWSDW